MSSFTKPLTVEKLKDGGWKVSRSFEYYIDEEEDNVVLVPEGFRTDFASVPRVFWIIFPPDGKYTAAAVVHDYLYFSQERTRRESDEIFLEAMGVLGVSWWKRRIMYRAVRIFGIFPWRKRAKKISEETKKMV